MLDDLSSLAQILTTLGLTAAALSFARRVVERRRWERYRRRVNDWTDSMFSIGIRIDKRLTEEEWQCECEIMLAASGFTPTEIAALLPSSVVLAKGTASTKFLF